MLIPLSDPIWTRLYGAYGLQDVPGELAQLERGWDREIAQTLFWEMLFHQEDVYPVTYAALPWIWRIIGLLKTPQLDALGFFSKVLDSSQRRDGPKSRFYGLSLNPKDHAKPWLPVENRLTQDDMAILAQLEVWLTRSQHQIVAACVEAVPADDAARAADLCIGFCALRQSRGAVNLLLAILYGHDAETIDEYLRLTSQDIKTLTDLLRRLNGRNRAFDQAIQQYLSSRAP